MVIAHAGHLKDATNLSLRTVRMIRMTSKYTITSPTVSGKITQLSNHKKPRTNRPSFFSIWFKFQSHIFRAKWIEQLQTVKEWINWEKFHQILVSIEFISEKASIFNNELHLKKRHKVTHVHITLNNTHKMLMGRNSPLPGERWVCTITNEWAGNGQSRSRAWSSVYFNESLRFFEKFSFQKSI